MTTAITTPIFEQTGLENILDEWSENRLAKEIGEILPDDQHQHIAAILKRFRSTLQECYIIGIEPRSARVPVEHVEIGGLRVGLDASGNAVSASFGDGPIEHTIGWM